MALNLDIARTEAAAIKEVAEQVTYLLTRINWILDHNSDLSIDWAAVALPAYLQEDADGNLYGERFTRQAVANAVGSLDAIKTLLTAGTPSTGDHLGNLNLLSRPLTGKS